MIDHAIEAMLRAVYQAPPPTDDGRHQGLWAVYEYLLGDLHWLIAHGYEVSIEAGDHDGGADVAVRLDRAYWADVNGYPEDEQRTFWGGSSGTEGALRLARAWAEEHDEPDAT